VRSVARAACLVVAVLLVMVIGSASTRASTKADGGVGYKPPILPVKLSMDSNGKISISGDKELVTPIGTFSIGATYSLPHNESGTIYVVLRNRRLGDDFIYEVRTGEGEFNAVVNGRTVIHVKDDRVTIDVTDAAVETIQFRGAEPVVDEEGSPSLWVQRWKDNWNSSFYQPFGLFRWAYDDSMVDRWHGLGWVVFVLRFVVALVLSIVDVVLTAVFLVAAVAYVFFGDGGRNFVYGLALVPVALLGITALVSARA
jgi:hypothetical protein